MKIELGREYVDMITGFKGICTGHAEYLSGCNQSLLNAKTKNNEAVRAEWFDDQRLSATSAKPVVLDNSKTPGCDRQAPIR